MTKRRRSTAPAATAASAGGVRDDFVLTDPATGEVSVVDWRAPALNTVLLRYSREEVRFILTYGRPGTPMPAWGVEGGGPLNDQQIQNLIDYLDANQITPEEAQEAAAAELERYMDADFEDGDAVFGARARPCSTSACSRNFAGGAFACARCHTPGGPTPVEGDPRDRQHRRRPRATRPPR